MKNKHLLKLGSIVIMSIVIANFFIFGVSQFGAFSNVYAVDYLQYGDLTYYITSDNEVGIKRCSDSITDLVIPSEINGLPVTKISSSAFSDSNLVSITIPDSINNISLYAFSDCINLKNVKLSGGIKYIEDSLFEGCTSLEEIIVPDGVERINRYAFLGCTSLKNVSIPDSVIYIDEKAFNDTPYINDIEASSDHFVILGNGFLYKYIRESENPDIVIPDGIRAINYRTFYMRSDITSIVIPDSVVYLGNNVLEDCMSLKKVVIGKGVTRINSSAFSDCCFLNDVEIKGQLEYIGGGAFYDCDSLKKIQLPDCIKTIDYGAFNSCDELTEINLPYGLAKIGQNAFLNCEQLMNISVPYSVKEIGESAFAGTKFQDYLFSVSDDFVILGYGVLYKYIGSDEEVDIPYGVVTIGDNAISNLVTKYIYIPFGVSKIGDESLYWCQYLENIYIPPTVNEVGYSAISAYNSTVISGYDDTFIEQYATDNKIPFYSLGSYGDVAKGDINGDGSIDYIDMILLQKNIITACALSDVQVSLADMNSDNNINCFDLIKLKHNVLQGEK